MLFDTVAFKTTHINRQSGNKMSWNCSKDHLTPQLPHYYSIYYKNVFILCNLMNRLHQLRLLHEHNQQVEPVSTSSYNPARVRMNVCYTAPPRRFLGHQTYRGSSMAPGRRRNSYFFYFTPLLPFYEHY